MKITLAQWLKIDALQKAAVKAVDDLAHELCMTALTKELPNTDAHLFLKWVENAEDAKTSLGVMDTTPQSEWMGGPTSGPQSKNTKTYVREPHPCGLSNRRYFTAQEVQDAKDQGLLQGGTDLTGPTV